MSSDPTGPMAVEAPVTAENPPKAAGLPHVNTPEPTAGARKRELSEDRDRETSETKKARISNGHTATIASKRRNIIASSDEEEEVDVPTLVAPISDPARVGNIEREESGPGQAEGTVKGDIEMKNAASDSSDDDKPLKKSVNLPAKSLKPPSSSKSKSEGKISKGAKALDSSDDDIPLSKVKKEPSSTAIKKDSGNGNPSKASSSTTPAAAAPKRRSKPPTPATPSSESEDDAPLSKKRGVAKPAYKEEESDPSSDDDEPLIKKKTATNGKGKGKMGTESNGKKVKKESVKEEEDVKPKIKTKKQMKVVEDPLVEVKVEKKRKKEVDDEEEGYKWWEQDGEEEDDSVKWNTLEHNGVMFPPPYMPLPKNVKMKYDGTPLTLPPEAEEVAGFFAALIETEHAQDKTFRANFFNDWKKILEKYPPAEKIKITSLEKCDFKPMYEYFEQQKEKKKTMTAAEKKQLKADKDVAEKAYLFCTIDGRKEKVGNFRVEPPGLFRGRGEHPKKGTFKFRLAPEDIVINIGENSPVPRPNISGNWKKIQHDKTVTWLAHWKENVNGNSKYVFLAAGSTWKGQSDRQKFEKARELHKHVDVIRKDYTAELKSKVMADRQRATAMYLIDRLALRAGNEKGEEEADTVGCCSLRLEHVTLIPPSNIELRFLGKDSIMYEQEVEVDPQVFKNIKIFKADPKTDEDDLFDRLTTAGLNKHLGNYMKGLTAKVFRTYNASYTFQKQLVGTPSKGTVQEKIAWYNKANKEVAILCNHQKTVSKTHETSMEKLGDKLRGMKYQRMKLRAQLFGLDPKSKKRHPELVDDESDLDDDFFERWEAQVLESNLDKAAKKHERENSKAEAAGEPQQPESVLKARLAELKADHKVFVKERKTGKVEAKKGATEEKILEQIKKMDDRISAFKVSLNDRESNKTVALGTSKINYIDPRLTVAWATKFNVPLEKLFSKTLITKFPWAMAEIETDPEWKFC